MAGNPETIDDVKFEDSPANKHTFSSTLFDASDYKIGIVLNYSRNECIIIKQNQHAHGIGPEILREFYASSTNTDSSNNRYIIPNPDYMEEEEEKKEALKLLDSITIDAGDENVCLAKFWVRIIVRLRLKDNNLFIF
jgi:hypothetical protein